MGVFLLQSPSTNPNLIVMAYQEPNHQEGKFPNQMFQIWNKHGRGRRPQNFDFAASMEVNRARSKISWSIPSQESLELISSYGKIIEVACGTGYWANLLKQYGADIIAVDPLVEGNGFTFFPEGIQAEADTYLKENKGCPDRTLFVSWPRDNLIQEYKGDTIIWIGEGGDGCTWNMENESEWEAVKSVWIPTFYGLHDYLKVYKRKLVEEGWTKVESKKSRKHRK